MDGEGCLAGGRVPVTEAEIAIFEGWSSCAQRPEWTGTTFALWDRNAYSCARSSPQAQKGQVLEGPACTEMARSERFELPTLGIEIRCSIQLSYERLRPADYQTWPGRASSGSLVLTRFLPANRHPSRLKTL